METAYEEGYRAAFAEWVQELNKVMPQDYKDWHQNCDSEKPLIARLTIESLIKQLECPGFDNKEL